MWCALKSFIFTFAWTIGNNFRNKLLKLRFPEPLSHTTHPSCDYIILLKRCISSFIILMTANILGRLSVRVKSPRLPFQLTSRSRDRVFFEKRHVSISARPQNSAGNTKHKKAHKSKPFCVIQKVLTFDSYWYATL